MGYILGCKYRCRMTFPHFRRRFLYERQSWAYYQDEVWEVYVHFFSRSRLHPFLCCHSTYKILACIKNKLINSDLVTKLPDLIIYCVTEQRDPCMRTEVLGHLKRSVALTCWITGIYDVINLNENYEGGLRMLWTGNSMPFDGVVDILSSEVTYWHLLLWLNLIKL